jgi:ubiquinone/menaquinone biosynthesis C-methylase UbiE
MVDKTPEKSQNDSGKQERYTHGYESKFVDYLESRKVSKDAAFFVPHIKSVMSLIDCGCGPGTITIDLAKFIAPGHVVGIDFEENQINIAQKNALERKVPNVKFEVGDIYKLPYPDNSFDAAFAHTIFQHLEDPVKAAIEIHRVLKPGGIIGLREEDTAGFIVSPFTPKFGELMKLYVKTWKHNGGDPYFARRQRAVLNEAGFVRVEASASAESYGTPESTRKMGEMMADYMRTHLETAIQLNWVDKTTVETLTAEWRSWGEHPDAFFGVLFCEAVGWVE